MLTLSGMIPRGSEVGRMDTTAAGCSSLEGRECLAHGIIMATT